MKPSGTSPERTVHTVCPLDCPDACHLQVTVQDGRVVAVDGASSNPITGGYICAKVRRFADHVYGSDRVLYPAIRKGPKGLALFERVSWDTALDRIADQFSTVRREHGGEAILPYSYGGSNGLLTQDTSDATLFARLGASRLLRTVCAAPTGAANLALYGDRQPWDPRKDFAGLAALAWTHSVLVVPASLPVNSLKEFVAYAKAKDRKSTRLNSSHT